MSDEHNLKANLTIILKANDMIIAESTDAFLWQKVLGIINKPQEDTSSTDVEIETDRDLNFLSVGDDSITKLASELGVSIDVIRGSCAPEKENPFIHLDKHHWEAMKKGAPSRGPKSISPIVLASTILILWKGKTELGENTTTKEAQKVLKTINVRDSHPKRSIENCEWLQLRNNKILLNPAQTSKAIEIVNAYCTKDWSK